MTYRAMLLSDVVVGEAFKMAAEDETPAEVKLRISSQSSDDILTAFHTIGSSRTATTPPL